MRYVWGIALCVLLALFFLFYFNNEDTEPSPSPSVETPLPLPPHTARLVADILHIATADSLNFQALWEDHSQNTGLRGLIQKRWTESNPASAQAATRDSEYEKLFWVELGSLEGETAYRHAVDSEFQDPWFALIGWAHADPRSVIKFINSEHLSLSPKQSEEVIPAILRGLAKISWLDGLRYPAEAQLPDTYGFESIILREWAEKNPDDLLEYLLSNHRRYDNELIESVTRVVGKNKPSLLEGSLQRLPTGAIKNTFQDILENGGSHKAHCPPNPLESPTVSIQRKEGAPDFLALVAQASKITTEEYPIWIMGKFFNYLPIHEQQLIRQIVTQRWIMEDPAAHIKFLDSHHIDDCVESFVRWIEIDRESAFQFAISGRHRGNKELPHQQFLVALGHTEFSEAFQLLLMHLGKINYSYHDYRWDDWGWTRVFREFAAIDPEAYQRETLANIHNGKLSLDSLIEIWQNRDLPWLLQFFEKHDLDLITLRKKVSSNLLLENFQWIPSDWHRGLLDSIEYISNRNIHLFVQVPPAGFPPQLLEKSGRHIQISLRTDLSKKNRGFAEQLMLEGNFLGEASRNALARAIVSSFGSDTDKASIWIQTIPEQFRSHALNRLDREIIRLDRQLKKEETKRNHPSLLLEALEMSPQELNLRFTHYWTDDHWDLILQKIASLSPKVAKSVIDTNHHQDLPYRHKAALISQASLAVDGTNRTLSEVPGEASRIAQIWASSEPVTASQWAEKLPPGIIRENALHMVAHEWKKFDREEMNSWAKTLSAEEREMLGVY